jgi:hypothetical protein
MITRIDEWRKQNESKSKEERISYFLQSQGDTARWRNKYAEKINSGNMPKILYHGTTIDKAEKIMQDGMKNGMCSTDIDCAKFYGSTILEIKNATDDDVVYIGHDLNGVFNAKMVPIFDVIYVPAEKISIHN